MRTLLDAGLVLREHPAERSRWAYRLPTAPIARMALSQLPWRRAIEQQQMSEGAASMRKASTLSGMRRLMAEGPTLVVFQDALMEIVQDVSFKRSTYRMLLILFVEVQPANYHHV